MSSSMPFVLQMMSFTKDIQIMYGRKKEERKILEKRKILPQSHSYLAGVGTRTEVA